LGHRIGGGRAGIQKKRVQALRNYTKPRTNKGLRTFLGVVGFYHRYIHMLAKYTATLSPATAKAEPNVVAWTKVMDEAFHAICKCVCDGCELEIPLPTDRFSLVTDASGCNLEAVLQVERDKELAPAAFFSRQMRGPERRYSASELKALAVVESVKHFSPYLYSAPSCSRGW